MAQAVPEAEHAFITALPPETDYISYLTIVEANLSKESLPLLNRLLQDARLTTNIGWDLVHLLAPLLPESGDCMYTIARLGNPREVVLKANELLEVIAYDAATADDSSVSGLGDEETAGDGHPHVNNNSSPEQTLRKHQQRQRLLQFNHLLRMVGTLHPRIKTRRPSKFLETIVEAVINAYERLQSSHFLRREAKTGIAAQEASFETHGNAETRQVDMVHEVSATEAVVKLLADLSSVVRPPLPPRTASASSTTARPAAVAADPEAEPEEASEGNLQRRILVGLAARISSILNARMRQCFPPQHVSWTARYMREIKLQKSLRHSDLAIDPGAVVSLERAREAMKSLQSTLRTRLGVRDATLLAIIKNSKDGWLGSAQLPEQLHNSDDGLLSLLADSMFHGESAGGFAVMDHRYMVSKFLGKASSIGFDSDSLTTIDALLFLGIVAWSNGSQYSWTRKADDGKAECQGQDQDDYNEYLQQLSVISAHAPFPELRYQAHALVTRILRTTDEAGLKYGFIQDTLEFCPFANLRVTAVGWLKDEMLAAAETCGRTGTEQVTKNKFLQFETLDRVAVSLFDAADAEDGGDEIAAMLPFWLAVLNLLYVVCCNKTLAKGLQVARLAQKYDLRNRFVSVLEALAVSMLEEEQTDDETKQELLSDAMLLADAAERGKAGLAKLAT